MNGNMRGCVCVRVLKCESVYSRPLTAIDKELALYEEVEAFTGRRPVLVFGALCDQVVALLLESYPALFYTCPTGRCGLGHVTLSYDNVYLYACLHKSV